MIFLLQSVSFLMFGYLPLPPTPEFQYCGFFDGCVFATIQLAAAALSIKVQLCAVPVRKSLHCSQNPSLASGFGVRGERWFRVPGSGIPLLHARRVAITSLPATSSVQTEVAGAKDAGMRHHILLQAL